MNVDIQEDLSALQRVRESFALQGAMQTLGARLSYVMPGAVDICFDWSAGLTQQHGFVHAGMLSAAMDSACGYAAFTLMPPDAEVLSIEFKANFLAPAQVSAFRCEGRVLKPGRTIMVAQSQAFACDGAGHEKLVSTMTCTLMVVQGRREITRD